MGSNPTTPTREFDELGRSPRRPPPPARAWAALAPLLIALAPAGCRDASPPQVLLLVTVDTLRADRLGVYGSDLGLTPHLDALAAESQVFEFAFAPTSFTLPSVASILTGRYPEETGILGNSAVLPPDVPTLAALLSERGVRTGAVVGNWVLRRTAGLARGFDIYDDRLGDEEAVRGRPERIASATTDAVLETLDRLLEGAGAVFLWAHYQDPHGPYTPPPGYRESYLEVERRAPDGSRLLDPSPDNEGKGGIPRYQFLDGRREVAFYRAGYDGEVRYLDEEFGRLWRGLQARDLAERTVLVFAADHGEGLGEGDYWFAHGDFLTEPLVRVPLLLRVPGRAPERRADVASLLDLFTTLLALHGVQPPPDPRGRDLLASDAAPQPSAVYLASLGASDLPRWGLIREGYHYRVHFDGAAARESIAPLGGDELASDAGNFGPLVAMRGALAAFRAELVGRPMSRQRLSPEDEERLRALGYADD